MFDTLMSMIERADSFINERLKMGGPEDLSSYTRFERRAPMAPTDLDTIFSDNPAAAKIVKAIPRAVIRAGWTYKIPGAKQQENRDFTRLMIYEEQRLRMRQRMREGAFLGRLYGAITWIGAEDGGDPSTPLNLDAIQRVSFLQTIPRTQLSIDSYDTDPGSDGFLLPLMYSYTPASSGIPISSGAMRTLKIHRSRVVVWSGEFTTPERRRENGGWDSSVLEYPRESLQRAAEDVGALSMSLRRLTSLIFRVGGLDSLLAADHAKFLRRVALLDPRSNRAGMTVIDSQEAIEQITQPINGLDKIVNDSIDRVALDGGLSLSVFGRPVPVEQAKHEMLLFEADAIEWRDAEFKANHEYIASMIMRAKDGPLAGVEPDEWDAEYNPIRELTQDERATIGQKNADADAKNIASGIYYPEDAAERYSSQRPDVTLDEAQLEHNRAKRIKRRDEPTKDNAEAGTYGARISGDMELIRSVVQMEAPLESAIQVLMRHGKIDEAEARATLEPAFQLALQIRKLMREGLMPQPGRSPGPKPGPDLGTGAGAPQGLPNFNAGGDPEADE